VTGLVVPTPKLPRDKDPFCTAWRPDMPHIVDVVAKSSPVMAPWSMYVIGAWKLLDELIVSKVTFRSAITSLLTVEVGARLQDLVVRSAGCSSRVLRYDGDRQFLSR
jgi:hypothetical protein